ncbi:MAG: FAD-dependent oxidoreductase [Oscillospiraceae bacterium]|nr:FAD-dependent oxidoreductase [Oscillospiraceae bacterium]
MYDILIVGGGTAGLTAAIYARRAGRTVLVLEGNALGGQITSSPLVENYPGLPAVSGADYAQALHAQAVNLGTEVKFGRVSAAQKTEGGFTLTVRKKTYEGKALILCTGVKHRHLGLEGEEALTGRGVSYCATCDGAFFKGMEVAVAGGGDSALQSALYLSAHCRKVYLIHRRTEFRAEAAHVAAMEGKDNITPLLGWNVTGLAGEESLTELTLTHAQTGEEKPLAVSGLFIAIGQEPENGPFAHLAPLDEFGYFAAGEDCCTPTPGVFVAGDCRAKTLRQLTTAAGDGSVAATAACQWLATASPLPGRSLAEGQ